MIEIELTPAMLTLADSVAAMRQRAALRHDRKPGNGLEATLEEQQRLHILGARSERAGEELLAPIRWHSFRTGKLSNVPDLEAAKFAIDVKATKVRGADLRCKVGGVKPSWIYLLAWPEADVPYWQATRFTFVGWCRGEAFRSASVGGQAGRPMYTIPADALSSVQSLVELVHPPKRKPLEFRCKVCGVEAGFGFGVSIRRDLLGAWYCGEHRPSLA